MVKIVIMKIKMSYELQINVFFDKLFNILDLIAIELRKFEIFNYLK